MPTYVNGRIPASLLKRVSNFVPLKSNVNSRVGSDLLREDAHAAVSALQVAFLRQFGRSLNISEAYRSRELQDEYWDLYLRGIGNLAAVPGSSNHGWAVSCDFGSGAATFGSAAKVWLDANAPRFGWHPTGNKFSRPEAWHFDYVPNTATEVIPASGSATPFPTEDEMTAAEIADLKAHSDRNTDNLATLMRQLTSARTDDLAGLVRAQTDPLVQAMDDPRPEAQHRLVRLKGQVHVFHSVDFHTMRWVRTEKDLADLGWQLQQIDALSKTATIPSQVVEVGTLSPFGTILGARPVDAAGKVLAEYATL